VNKGKEKILYVVIIVVIIAVFIGAYFLLDNMLFGKEENKKTGYKQEITTLEVEEKMTQNGLSKHDLSSVLKDTKQNASYIYFNTNRNYEIIYSNFNDVAAATSNYNTNLSLVDGKYDNLTELTKVENENYAKYEAENTDNYVVILKIGTAYFQVETSKNNKSSVQNIISGLES